VVKKKIWRASPGATVTTQFVEKKAEKRILSGSLSSVKTVELSS
jgi:hypothetical protein